MSPAPIAPEYWTENKDSKGRIFYSNHRTKTTSWERPEPSEPSSPNGDPPPYTPRAKATQNSPSRSTWSCTPALTVCTPSFALWVAAVLSWVVWALAVSISMDDQWFDNVDDFSAGDDVIQDGCHDDELSDEFCDLYNAFTALQFTAVSVVSVSVLLFVAALFRPAAGRFFSTCALLIAGATLMAVYALFQMLAFVSVVIIGKTEKGFGATTTAFEDPELGPTFEAAVAAVLMAMLQAGAVLVFARGSGDGPFFDCVHNCMGMNSRSMPGSGGAMPQPPRPIARTPARTASPDSGSRATAPRVQITIPSPIFSPDVVVERSAVRPTVVSGTDRPLVASPVVQPAVVSWADPIAVSSPTVQLPAASQAVQSSEETKSFEQAVEAPSVRPPAGTPAVQHGEASRTVEPTIANPAIQSPEASPAVRPRASSLTVEPPVASEYVEPPVTSPTVEPAVASQPAQSPAASPDVQPAVVSKAVESPAESPDVQPAVASAAVESPQLVSAVEATVAVQSPSASPAVQPAIASAGVESPVPIPAADPAVGSPAVLPAVGSPDV